MDVPQLDFSTYPSQIFWLLLCVIFLFFFIKNVFVPRVLSILETRERRIQGDRERAQEAQARAQQLRQEYEGKFLENQKEARHQAESHLQGFKKFEKSVSRLFRQPLLSIARLLKHRAFLICGSIRISSRSFSGRERTRR